MAHIEDYLADLPDLVTTEILAAKLGIKNQDSLSTSLTSKTQTKTKFFTRCDLNLLLSC